MDIREKVESESEQTIIYSYIFQNIIPINAPMHNTYANPIVWFFLLILVEKWSSCYTL